MPSYVANGKSWNSTEKKIFAILNKNMQNTRRRGTQWFKFKKPNKQKKSLKNQKVSD